MSTDIGDVCFRHMLFHSMIINPCRANLAFVCFDVYLLVTSRVATSSEYFQKDVNDASDDKINMGKGLCKGLSREQNLL